MSVAITGIHFLSMLDGGKGVIPKYATYIKMTISGAIFFALLSTFMPTTKTMMLILGGNAVIEVVKNPEVQNIASSSAHLIEEFLKNKIDEQKDKKDEK